jgi:hypothetical protein
MPTVCNLQNEYNQFKYLKENSQFMPLNTIKGTANKSISKRVYIYELTKEFDKKVNDYFRNLFYEYTKGKREILTPSINKYYYQANILINDETNQTIVQNKFHLLSKEWIKSYQKNLTSQLEGTLVFSEYDGCSDNSRRWRNSFLKFIATSSPKNKEEFEMYQNGYEDCLKGSIKKYNAKIKKKEKENAK